MSSLSSTIAKCWKLAWSLPPRMNDSWPRCAIARVGFVPLALRRVVKSKVTLGWPRLARPLSKFCSGFLMSLPAAPASCMTYSGRRLRRPSRVRSADDDALRDVTIALLGA
jgi:hypothetical protein